MSTSATLRAGISDHLDEAAALLMSATADNKSLLAKLLTALEAAREKAGAAGQPPRVVAGLDRLRDTAEGMIFDELPFADAVRRIGEGIDALQAIFRDGRSPDDPACARFLALDGAATPAAAAGGLDLSALVGEFVTGKLLSLDEMEAAALALERGWDPERRKELMRAFHTMKGEAAVLGLPELEEFCHEIEDYFETFGRSVSIEYILRVKDFLKTYLEALGRGEPPPAPGDQILPELMLIKRRPAAAAAAVEPPPVFLKKPGLTKKLKSDEFMVREFASCSLEHLESADQMLLRLERDAADRDALDTIFRSFHTIKGMASFVELDDVTGLAHEAENLFQKARDGECALNGYAIDLVFLTVDALRSMVNAFLAAFEADRDPEVAAQAPGLILSLRKAYRDRPAERPAPEAPGRPATPGAASPPAEKTAEPDGRAGETARPETDQGSRIETVKVDAKKLDHLADTIGELVIVESMVTHDPDVARLHSQRLLKNLSHMGKICRELQEMAMGLRMMPLKSTFQKMSRVARDISRKLGKRIDLAISGEETEIDRMLVEKINDPLIHMIRNAVDHGIEKSIEERLAKGKPAEGHVRLTAYHESGKIIIEVGDDGGGLDRARILRKAKDLGLAGEEADSLTDAQVHDLVFRPGFSTAEKVSDVSGRGVGMDVVRKNIEELSGRVEIHSVKDRGTSFKVVLPLTLAIIDGMIVRSGEQRFIVPTLSVVEALKASDVKVRSVRGGAGRMFELRGRMLPLLDLTRAFGIAGAGRGEGDATADGAGIIVVLQDFGTRAGVSVDELLGQQQIVIKSIAGLARTEGVAGGAILSDGSVGLILDVAALLRELAAVEREGA